MITREENDHLESAMHSAFLRGLEATAESFGKTLLVGPFDDSSNHGAGFAIYAGAFRIGWFPTRKEACDAADAFAKALIAHCGRASWAK